MMNSYQYWLYIRFKWLKKDKNKLDYVHRIYDILFWWSFKKISLNISPQTHVGNSKNYVWLKPYKCLTCKYLTKQF